MRLISLRLRNFRQHADTSVTFRPGLTGIIGPNGAGKSTILEAIAWALYGAQAARGTNDTIRFTRAGPRSRVEVELRFGLGGHEYRVVRTLNGAEVFLDGSAAPVAATLGGVTQYLQSRIGMSREEFFNTYFTGQKELQFLAAMGPTERGRFLSQVLGYERLRRAQDVVRDRKKELRAEVKGLKTTLGDIEELKAALIEAQRQVGEAVASLKEAQAETEVAAGDLRATVPKWEAAQAARERHRELSQAVEAATREVEVARRDVARAEAELESVAKAEAELAPLRKALEALPATDEECRRFADLARKEERRKALARQLADLDGELARGAERLERLESAPELEKKYAWELEKLRAERTEVEKSLEEKKSAWLADRQDAFTKLQNYRDRGKELKEQIRSIEQLGPEGTCPTCGRPVGDDYERLLDELNDQWVSIVQDGKWWSSRYEQIEKKPEEVGTLEELEKQLAAAIDDRAHKHTRCQSAIQELEGLRKEREGRAAKREEVAAELEAVPTGYDPKLHRAAETRLRELQETGKKAARFEETARRRGDWEGQREEARKREGAALRAVGKAAEEREALAFSQDDFDAAKAAHEAAAERHRRLELRATELKGVVRVAEQTLQTARRAEADYHARAQDIRERESELKHHDELDVAYTELRTELNDQVRPELSEIASTFLAQLTDGRYTSMEIDESYNILVLDEGEEKPVISGGEEDVANLVLRLSLSQMIAERAGHPLSLLILDEVFGSLDVARRDNVVSLLHNLEDRFEQVILITHIEGIRESLDQVLRVEYDERAGTSVVREESNFGDDDGGLPEAPMAAD